MIIFGSRASNLGSVTITNTQCSYCENTGTQNIVQYGRYFHVFWIPVFPIGRKTFSECTHCKRTISKKDFGVELMHVFNEKKDKIKRPLWHWIGLLLFGLLVIWIAVVSKIS